jgi:hypothetical protein
VDSQLGRRLPEDEPAIVRVYPGQAEHVAEKRTGGVRVAGVDDRVHAGNHWLIAAFRMVPLTENPPGSG